MIFRHHGRSALWNQRPSKVVSANLDTNETHYERRSRMTKTTTTHREGPIRRSEFLRLMQILNCCAGLLQGKLNRRWLANSNNGAYRH